MVVDLGLPDGDGLDLVREVRQRGGHTPILVVTARRGVEDRVVGLISGADDYLTKPFALPELRARVVALLRRPAHIDRTRSSLANIVVDRDVLEAMVDDKSLGLTRKQFALLELLIRRKGHMTPKRMIEETLYGFDDAASPNSIEVHVYKLRAALRAGRAHATIETRRGIGYRLVETQPPRDPRRGDWRAAAAAHGAVVRSLARLDPDGSFQQRLVDDHRALTALGRRIHQRGDRVLVTLAKLAHRLAGAAGTFGYERIGDAAACLEQRAETTLAATGPRRQKLLVLVEPKIENLSALIDAAIAKDGSWSGRSSA
jgi:DNA-binding response OmpR family regulator/HPt (histidine-containing phosphotransfer) domain-containing protein